MSRRHIVLFNTNNTELKRNLNSGFKSAMQ